MFQDMNTLSYIPDVRDSRVSENRCVGRRCGKAQSEMQRTFRICLPCHLDATTASTEKGSQPISFVGHFILVYRGSLHGDYRV